MQRIVSDAILALKGPDVGTCICTTSDDDGLRNLAIEQRRLSYADQAR